MSVYDVARVASMLSGLQNSDLGRCASGIFLLHFSFTFTICKIDECFYLVHESSSKALYDYISSGYLKHLTWKFLIYYKKTTQILSVYTIIFTQTVLFVLCQY